MILLSEFKRVKHGELPGDVSRKTKIKMRERSLPFWIWPWQYISDKCIQSFRRDLRQKSKKRQRRRDKETIKEGLGSCMPPRFERGES